MVLGVCRNAFYSEHEMNERIKELAEQCYHRYSEHNIDLEKFAQLIVGECIKILADNSEFKGCVIIVKHFGVEE
jgi:hypothetical protein